jgi:hypothetical protein
MSGLFTAKEADPEYWGLKVARNRKKTAITDLGPFLACIKQTHFSNPVEYR